MISYDIITNIISLCSGGVMSVLPPAASSTVPGPRPHCVLPAVGIDRDNIIRRVRHSLQNILHLSHQVQENIVITMYHTTHMSAVHSAIVSAGYSPCYLYKGGEGGEQGDGLRHFLGGQGGILVTSQALFEGMEADTIVFIGGGVYGVRSSMLRAVGKLIFLPTYKQNEGYLSNFQIENI